MNIFDYMVSLQDACKMYDKKPSTLKTHIAQGTFKIGVDVKKFGNTWVFRKDSLEEYYNKKINL